MDKDFIATKLEEGLRTFREIARAQNQPSTMNGCTMYDSTRGVLSFYLVNVFPCKDVGLLCNCIGDAIGPPYDARVCQTLTPVQDPTNASAQSEFKVEVMQRKRRGPAFDGNMQSFPAGGNPHYRSDGNFVLQQRPPSWCRWCGSWCKSLLCPGKMCCCCCTVVVGAVSLFVVGLGIVVTYVRESNKNIRF